MNIKKFFLVFFLLIFQLVIIPKSSYTFDSLYYNFKTNDTVNKKNILDWILFQFSLKKIQMEKFSTSKLLKTKAYYILNFELKKKKNQVIYYELLIVKNSEIQEILAKGSIVNKSKNFEKTFFKEKKNYTRNPLFLKLTNEFVDKIFRTLQDKNFKTKPISSLLNHSETYVDFFDLVFVLNPYMISSEFETSLDSFIEELQNIYFFFKKNYPSFKIRIGIIYNHLIHPDKILPLTEDFDKVKSYIKEKYYPINVQLKVLDLLQIFKLSFYHINWSQNQKSPKFIFHFINNEFSVYEINALNHFLHKKNKVLKAKLPLKKDKKKINIFLEPLVLEIPDKKQEEKFIKNTYLYLLAKELQSLKIKKDFHIQFAPAENKNDSFKSKIKKKEEFYIIKSYIEKKNKFYQLHFEFEDQRLIKNKTVLKLKYSLHDLKDLYILIRFLKKEIGLFFKEEQSLNFFNINGKKNTDLFFNFSYFSELYNISNFFVLANHLSHKSRSTFKTIAKAMKGNIIPLNYHFKAYYKKEAAFYDFYYKNNILFQQFPEQKNLKLIAEFKNLKLSQKYLEYAGYDILGKSNLNLLHSITAEVKKKEKSLLFEKTGERKKTKITLIIDSKKLSYWIYLNKNEILYLKSLQKNKKKIILLVSIIETERNKGGINLTKTIIFPLSYKKKIPKDAFINLLDIRSNLDFYIQYGIGEQNYWAIQSQIHSLESSFE